MKTILLFLVPFMAFAQSKIIEGQYGRNTKQVTNYIKNPGCYVDTQNVTASGGSFTRNTTTPLNSSIGADCKIDASASAQTYTWAVKTMDGFLKGRNCEARFDYSGDASLYIAYVKIGSNKVTADLTLTNETLSKRASLAFPCGDMASATTVVIESTSASAAAFQLTNVEASEAINVGSDSFITEWKSYTPTTQGFGTPSAYAVYWRRVGDTLQVRGTMTVGTVTAVEARLGFPSGLTSSSTDKIPALRVAGVNFRGNNTTNKGGPLMIEPSVTYFTFAPQDIFGSNSSNSSSKANGSSVCANGEQILFFAESPIQGWAPSNAVKMDQSNYDWTAYTPTFTGFGTPSNVSCFHKRDGADLIVQCKFTSGTSTAVASQITLPGSLTVDSTWAPNNRHVGSTAYSVASGSQRQVIANGGNGYVQISCQDGSNIGLNACNGSTIMSSGESISLLFRVKITGWVENQNAPLLVGSVTSAALGSERHERIRIANSGTPTITSQSGSWVSSLTDNGTGDVTINIASGIFSDVPTCTCMVEYTALARFCYINTTTTPSTTAVRFQVANDAGSGEDRNIAITCTGPR